VGGGPENPSRKTPEKLSGKFSKKLPKNFPESSPKNFPESSPKNWRVGKVGGKVFKKTGVWKTLPEKLSGKFSKKLSGCPKVLWKVLQKISWVENPSRAM
jgi:hypothetical protein